MGRKWLGVSSKKFQRIPHNNDGPPPSLWWYLRQPHPPLPFDDIPMPESQYVIATYLRRCSRGRALPNGFEKQVAQWLQELSRAQNLREHGKPRTTRYWTIPAYALAHRMNSKTLCKRLREMENIAKKLFPERVPSSRKRVPLTEERKQAIRDRFLEVKDFDSVAAEFGIEAFRVGQLCKNEKARIVAEREQAQATQEASSATVITPETENPF
jgi:hypothetical protein